LKSALFWDTTQRRAVILKDISVQTIGPKTSVSNCHIILRNISEERGSHPHRGGSPKSRIFKAFFLFGLLVHEDQDIVILRKVGKVCQPKRPNSAVDLKL
jgi:hypothetical protein